MDTWDAAAMYSFNDNSEAPDPRGGFVWDVNMKRKSYKASSVTGWSDFKGRRHTVDGCVDGDIHWVSMMEPFPITSARVPTVENFLWHISEKFKSSSFTTLQLKEIIVRDDGLKPLLKRIYEKKNRAIFSRIANRQNMSASIMIDWKVARNLGIKGYGASVCESEVLDYGAMFEQFDAQAGGNGRIVYVDVLYV
jgi:hypothetical protein